MNLIRFIDDCCHTVTGRFNGFTDIRLHHIQMYQTNNRMDRGTGNKKSNEQCLNKSLKRRDNQQKKPFIWISLPQLWSDQIQYWFSYAFTLYSLRAFAEYFVSHIDRNDFSKHKQCRLSLSTEWPFFLPLSFERPPRIFGYGKFMRA